MSPRGQRNAVSLALYLPAHNTQLQRTVMRHRARGAGAALPMCARVALTRFARPLNCTLDG